MPIYFYWGDDDYRLHRAVQTLRDQVLSPDWASFNYDRLPAEATMQGLNQAMTPPFGLGDRLVWLEETRLVQHCPQDLGLELERTLADLPTTTHLLLTSSAKPDGRLKSTKLLKQIATVQEFSLLPSWDSDGILKQVKAEAVAQQIRLSPAAAELLAVAVGNDARKLAMELEKLVLFAGETADSISAEMVQQLVPASAYNSFQVATALRQGNLDHALESLTHLLDHNEPALKILAVLVGQFRTWLWVKLMTEQGERDPKAIAQAAEIGNPNRVYFLQKEVLPVTGKSLHLSLSILLQLEYSLKRGQPEREAFPLALLRISQIFQRQRDLR